jgi:hypothetical protein
MAARLGRVCKFLQGLFLHERIHRRMLPDEG